MNSKRKIKCRLIGMLALAVTLLMSTASVQAGSYNWMASARQTAVNRVVNGTARNNNSPTLMDPYYNYEDYFYFKVPARMEGTITLSVKGTQMVSMSLYNNSGNYLCCQNGWSYNRSANKTNSVIQRTFTGGEYYIRLSNVFHSNTESYPYSLKIRGKMTASPRISRVSRASSKSARITWKKTGNVTGYEIFRKTAGGSYRKIATVSGRTGSYTNKGLKRGKTYYYAVRAYKTVNGTKVYSYASAGRKIRM